MSTTTSVVKEVRRNIQTHVVLANKRKLTLRPFLYLQDGDRLEVNAKSAWKVFGDRKRIRVHPGYEHKHLVRIGSHALDVVIREATSKRDWHEAKRFERYHYRGTNIKFIPGRKSILLAEVRRGPEHLMRRIVGYAVLASPLPAVSVRLKLLGQTFGEHLSSGAINRFVRIPRVVVAPELRGLGIGTLLAKACVNYAKTRWEIRGLKPWAVEVVAAMTDYHPFFQKAGFSLVGRTKAAPEPIRPPYGRRWGKRPDALSYQFRTFKNSKPYLLFPLTKALRSKVESNLASREEPKRSAKKTSRELLRCNRLVCAVRLRKARTSRSRLVGEAFGLEDAQDAQWLNLWSLRHLALRSGDVVLIDGPSGCGKTILAKTLAGLRVSRSVRITGQLRRVARCESAQLDDAPLPAIPLIDQLSPMNLDASVALLNEIGLSEPRLYQTTPERLSAGQLHRFRLALLAAGSANCWLADDFAAVLDDFSAAVVAHGIGRLAEKKGALLLVTSSYPGRIREALKPNVEIHIDVGGKLRVAIAE